MLTKVEIQESTTLINTCLLLDTPQLMHSSWCRLQQHMQLWIRRARVLSPRPSFTSPSSIYRTTDAPMYPLPGLFYLPLLHLSHDGSYTMEYTRWNAHDRMRIMEYARWNLRNRICATKPAQSNPDDGIRTIKSARWNLHAMESIWWEIFYMMEFAWWSSYNGNYTIDPAR